MSAIGSEKKQKMSSGAIEQESSNPDVVLQLKAPGTVHLPQEIPDIDTTVFKIGVKDIFLI